MTTEVPSNQILAVERLRANLDMLSRKLKEDKNSALGEILSEVTNTFIEFYDTLGQPEFSPLFLETGDVARAEDYNQNIIAIYHDLDRSYKELLALAQAQLQSFNYSQVSVQEILHRAQGLASTVLDLNILSGFTRGDTIVAGDDFQTMDNIDQRAVTASSKAERLQGGGMSLSRAGINNLSANISKIDITPLQPASSNGSVVITPTPENLERFYEGNYYNFMGQARPEGGQFRIKFQLTPPPSGQIVSTSQTDLSQAGVFVEIGATDAEKDINRRKMFDGDSSTFWECEWCFKLPNQLVDIPSTEIDQQTELDAQTIEDMARAADRPGTDLVMDITIELNEPQNTNFVSIDPVIFGSKSFPIVEDIATTDSTDGVFLTVDGWDTIRFDKTLTPQANEFLTDSELTQSLAPSRSAFTGKGIFPYPSRITKKIRIRLRIETPVPSVYEVLAVLLQNNVTVTTTTTTTTRRGALRF